MPWNRIGVLLALCHAGPGWASEWTHAAGDPQRSSIAPRAPRTLDHIRWTAPPDPNEEFVAHSSPIVAGGRVFVNARHFAGGAQIGNRLVAFAVFEGQRLWATDIQSDYLDSWSSPAADQRNGTVLIATGDELYAIDQTDGRIVWQIELNRNIVNASPVVTADLEINGTPANRVLITDYDGFGDAATLYCINVDPNAPNNPHAPGAIVWPLSLGRASGATPAYQDGVVYVASGAGFVRAIDVLNPPADPNVPGKILADWKQELVIPNPTTNEGFYGGLTVAKGALYSSMYDFFGQQDTATTFKLDAVSGALIWSIPSERTSSTPIVTPAHGVLLSAGISGFGSKNKVEQFLDQGATVAAGWDTAALDPNVILGGRTHQPAVARGYLYVGTPPDSGFFSPFSDLYIVDLARDPNEAGFIVDHSAGAGGSPALAQGRLFSIGSAGLVAFEPSASCAADFDGSGAVNISDLGSLLAAFGAARPDANFNADADIDLSGAVDITDLGALLAVFGETCE